MTLLYSHLVSFPSSIHFSILCLMLHIFLHGKVIRRVLLYTFRQYSWGSRLRDHHMSRIRDVSPLGGRPTRMLSASGDSTKSNLHYYTSNYRGSLSAASNRPSITERDGLPLKSDRFLFSKREELNEQNSSATLFHPNVKGMPKVHKATCTYNCTCKYTQHTHYEICKTLVQ